eukprot:TRINITY_DN2089_c0_g1_i1.p1 TRINITY_DN2089_c0_g1~~TRINITY_DN2089_c0_g1_i1.p1  ORF type:complete len:309 (+),score=44.93 TRINITY_DN2089_c0_g1_i1:26-952(+)
MYIRDRYQRRVRGSLQKPTLVGESNDSSFLLSMMQRALSTLLLTFICFLFILSLTESATSQEVTALLNKCGHYQEIKKSYWSQVNWSHKEIPPSLNRLVSDYGKNEHFCSILGAWRLLIRYSFVQRFCHKDDEWCSEAKGVTNNNLPHCTSTYCFDNPKKNCKAVIGFGVCTPGSRCQVSCLKIVIKGKPTSQRVQALLNNIWQYSNATYFQNNGRRGKRATLSHKQLRSTTDKDTSSAIATGETQLEDDNTKFKRSLIVYDRCQGSDCGCITNVTRSCRTCGSGAYDQGSPCWDDKLCCQCFIISAK